MKKIISLLLTISLILSATLFASAEAGTTLQHISTLDGELLLPVDTCMFYMKNPEQYRNAVDKLAEGTTPSIMIAINRVTREEIDSSGTLDDTMIQTNSNGSFIQHVGGDYYMVPTEELSEYMADSLVACAQVAQPYMIALEEPEMWTRGGYSQSFKDAWVEYYNEPWADPNENELNFYKACQLRIEMFKKSIELIAERVKAVSPETKIIIATHSVQGYKVFQIAPGVAQFAAMDCVDGIIGQTWSDTVNVTFRFHMQDVNDPFGYGYLEYSSYVDAARGKEFYALSDPASDNANMSLEEHRRIYKDSIAAQLVVPQIQKFEVVPWPNRAFAFTTIEYKTIQLNIYKAMQMFAGGETNFSTDVGRVKIGFSDTYGWHQDDNLSLLLAMSYELLSRGIPVDYSAIDTLETTADLADTDLLILNYEIQKPLTAKTNEVIAQWIKEGGNVLYIGGSDTLSTSEGMWYSEAGSPLQDLLNRAGLENIKVTAPALTKSEPISWLEGEEDYIGSFNMTRYDNYESFCLEGEGFTPLVRTDSAVFGGTTACGEGNLTLMSFSLKKLENRSRGQTLMNLVNYALALDEKTIEGQDAFICNRENFTIIHAFSDTVLEGKYIDLYSDDFSVIVNPEVKAGEEEIYLNVTNMPDMPTLTFANGQRVENLVQTEDLTSYDIFGPTAALVTSVIQAPYGTYPQSVTSDVGNPYISWDERSGVLVVTLLGYNEGAHIDVEWGSTRCNPSEKGGFNILTVATNESNEDSEFLFYSDAGVNADCRFADVHLQIIYRFDLTKYKSPTILAHIFQNYVVSVSTDNVNYQVIADYSKENPEHLVSGDNRKIFSFFPEDYGAETEFYFKIQNTDITKGNGGSIRQLSVITTSPDDTLYYGDTDADKLVELSDALRIFMHVAGRTLITDEKAFAQADINQNGEIDIQDAMSVFRYVAGKGSL